MQTVEDLRARAHRLMPRFVLEYLEAGSGEEATLAREREAFAEWRVIPHTLVDESTRDVSAPILGSKAPLPLAIAPTGLNGIFMHHADLALARAAAASGVPFIQSTMSNDRMEQVAAIDGLRHWWQLYVFGGEEVWQELVDRAERAGCEALVLTTNAQIFGQRDWDKRDRAPSGFPDAADLLNAATHPRWAVTTLTGGLPEFANVIDFVPKDRRSFFDSANWIRHQMPKTLSWRDVARIRDRWTRPFFVKGILNPDDVQQALDCGVDGVMLGAHGGRQADWSVSALDVLPRAREIVGDRIELYISGGIRRGSDILKACALGADAVLAGRAPLYGLCAHGEDGVRKAIELLRSEMLNELGQYGVPGLDKLSRYLLVRTENLPL
ncbi:alpha-hydroxy acid oxidase [Croceibacterium aestuarii]|uniref:alpha-hydroxy acid oxidase n=1 Tax=Croceibacterium aestuarii TaxID=3064139 RepID=UPI00272E707F|nr:alpha-hydroxy acid oxidase [Croceibacterium sp. D39]